jgi:hypothetical protein
MLDKLMIFLLTSLTLAALLSPSRAWAAPPQVENYCWAKASQIWFNGRGDREQFIANCIADLTPPPAKRSRNRNPR